MARFAQPGRPMPFQGMSYDQALDFANRGMEPPGADAMIRRREPDRVLTLSADDFADTVKVVCIVDTKPWTHERPLARGEQTVIPRKVAEVMAERYQITIISE